MTEADYTAIELALTDEVLMDIATDWCPLPVARRDILAAIRRALPAEGERTHRPGFERDRESGHWRLTDEWGDVYSVRLTGSPRDPVRFTLVSISAPTGEPERP